MSDGISEGYWAGVDARRRLEEKGWRVEKLGFGDVCFMIDPLTGERRWLNEAERIQEERELAVREVMES